MLYQGFGHGLVYDPGLLGRLMMALGGPQQANQKTETQHKIIDRQSPEAWRAFTKLFPSEEELDSHKIVQLKMGEQLFRLTALVLSPEDTHRRKIHARLEWEEGLEIVTWGSESPGIRRVEFPPNRWRAFHSIALEKVQWNESRFAALISSSASPSQTKLVPQRFKGEYDAIDSLLVNLRRRGCDLWSIPDELKEETTPAEGLATRACDVVVEGASYATGWTLLKLLDVVGIDPTRPQGIC